MALDLARMDLAVIAHEVQNTVAARCPHHIDAPKPRGGAKSDATSGKVAAG